MFPILRSGGYIAVSKQPSEGNDVKVTDAFVGYERSYYGLKSGGGQKVKITFMKTEVWENGEFHPRPKTSLPLFDPIAGANYVRLVYYIRVSSADHNMALVAASDPAKLEALTRGVIDSAVCGSTADGVCAWVPPGVAVTPEENLAVDGKRQWVPAR